MVQYQNSHDTCIILGYIFNDEIRDYFEEYIEISDKINRGNICKSYHLMFKSIIDEISSVISSYTGVIVKDMITNISELIPEQTTAITFEQQRKLVEYMDGLEQKFTKQKNLIVFIKEAFFSDDNYYPYYSLVDIKSRRKKLAEIRGLKSRFNINYFASFFQKNFYYYDSTEDILNEDWKESYDNKIKEVFKGARRGRNAYDYIHIYNCYIYSKKFPKYILHFTTKDAIILKGANAFKADFKILDISNLVFKLRQLIALPPEKE